MGRIIAIDYGTKRTGLATTDPDKIIATPLDTVHTGELLTYLKNYAQQEDIESFVVGMPTKLNGENTHATQHVVGFIRKLKKTFPEHPVYEEAEHFTSKKAVEAMIKSGKNKKYRGRKENIDKLSATLILKSFLGHEDC